MRLTVGSSPHVRQDDNITIMMGDMLIALVPVLCISVYYYGARVLILSVISVLSSVSFEYLYRRFFHKAKNSGDLSAAVTGILIVCCLPATAPWWFPVIGSFFAIVIVKQLFGGLGRNVFNPALSAVLFLTVTWPGTMSMYPAPFSSLPLFSTPRLGEAQTTVLSQLKSGLLPGTTLLNMFLGNRPGNLGVGAVLVILAAGLYLLYRRIINWQVPFAFLGTVALTALIFPRSPAGPVSSMLYELMSGSVLFVAVFMACEPVTSPVTRGGRLIYGALCGILTMFLRYYGTYPESSLFALLFMNPFAMPLDLLLWKQKTWLLKRGADLVEKG